MMEYCEHGDLLKYIQTKPALPLAEKRSLIRNILTALVHLHRVKKMVHRDLKRESYK